MSTESSAPVPANVDEGGSHDVTAGPFARSVTVGICTRNRPAALGRCLASLAAAGSLLDRVVVVDDASEPPVALDAGDPPDASAPTVIRGAAPRGVAWGRNEAARLARTPWLLFLDDDAFLVSGDALRAAVDVLVRDPEVAVVAFAQADEGGRPLPAAAQPADCAVPCQVPAFIGFAHLVRRDALLAAGGFREMLEINGEERELSLRLLDAGHRVVYLPDAAVAHVADQAGRDMRRFLFLTVRNDCLAAMLNEPLPLAAATVPLRLWRYVAMRRGWRVHDPGGFRRIIGALLRALPAVSRERRAVRWATIRRWRSLVRAPEPYAAPARRRDAP